MAEAAVKKSSPIVEYFRGFKVLRETRKEYWGLQVVSFLDLSAYFALANIVIVLLSEKFGYSDVWAGYVWTIASMVVSLTMFFTGSITDWLGIRRALVVALFGNVLGRAGLMIAGLVGEETLRQYTTPIGFDVLSGWVTSIGTYFKVTDPIVSHRAMLAFISLIVLAPFLGMTTTVYQAGNRRYTTSRARGAGFNLWYLIMNIGSVLGGVVVDFIRKPEYLNLDMTHIVTFGAICCGLGFFFTYPLLRTEQQLYGPDEEPEPEPTERKRGYFRNMVAVFSQAAFWRFLALLALIVNVRAIFIYLHVLYPKYWLRVIGPDAAYGFLQAFNPILVVAGLILFIPLLKRSSVFGMLMCGALISTASLFVLAVPAHGNAAYITSILSLLVLTVGEILWSPRLYEYTAAIAPRGQEGVYYGLSVLPWFVAKTLASAASGHMLKAYIPEFPAGEPILRDRLAAGDIPFWNSPSALFLYIGAFTLIGPLLAIIFRGWFTKGAHFAEQESAKSVSASTVNAEADTEEATT